MDFSIFRQRLQDLMDSRGLTMKSLSEKVNMTPATLSRYLSSDRTPDLAYIVRIVEYFDVSIDWILGYDDDKYAPLPPDQQVLINLYSVATPDDRRVIQAVLSKYRNKE